LSCSFFLSFCNLAHAWPCRYNQKHSFCE